jgi:hypothetical protein
VGSRWLYLDKEVRQVLKALNYSSVLNDSEAQRNLQDDGHGLKCVTPHVQSRKTLEDMCLSILLIRVLECCSIDLPPFSLSLSLLISRSLALSLSRSLWILHYECTRVHSCVCINAHAHSLAHTHTPSLAHTRDLSNSGYNIE